LSKPNASAVAFPIAIQPVYQRIDHSHFIIRLNEPLQRASEQAVLYSTLSNLTGKEIFALRLSITSRYGTLYSNPNGAATFCTV
jgi:hypothetical protein